MELSSVNITRIRVLVCFVLICILLAGLTATVSAAPSLQWHTDRVYYDDQGRLIVQGYFYNNGTHTITWINWHKLWVYFRQAGTDWHLQASATFTNLNTTLRPGDSVGWTFRITNVEYTAYDYWNVQWNVNYNFLNDYL